MIPKKPKLTEEEKQYLINREKDILTYFKKGSTIESLSETFSVTEDEIRHILRKELRKAKKRFIKYTASPKELEEIVKKIAELKNKDKTVKEISDIISINVDEVQEIVREFKIKVTRECVDCRNIITENVKRGRPTIRCPYCNRKRNIEHSVTTLNRRYAKRPEFRQKCKDRDTARRKRLKLAKDNQILGISEENQGDINGPQS